MFWWLKLKNFFYLLLNLGVTPELDSRLTKKVMFTNFIIAVFVVFILIFSVIFLKSGLLFLGVFSLFWTLSTAAWYIPIYLQKYSLARMGLLIWSNLMGLVVCWKLGKDAQFHIAYFVGITSPIMLFGVTEKVQTITCVLLSALCYTVLKWMPQEYSYQGIISPENIGYIRAATDLLIACVIFFSILYLSYRNHESETKLESYVDQLKESHLQLQESLRQTTEAQAISQQAGKMAALGIMAGGVAHEINSPLGAVRLNTEMIIAKCKKLELADPFIQKKAETILGICNRISKIILGLKSFSRDANLTDPEEFTLQKVVDSTLDLCQEKLRSNNIELIIQNPHFETLVFGKEIEVSQTLLNLLNNSFDAISKTPNPWIRIEAQIKGSSVELSVTDSGQGIPTEVRDQIFQPFFTTKGIGSGTGLGLSIAKGIIQKHGGDLYYDPNSANTKFVIQLPIHSKPAVA